MALTSGNRFTEPLKKSRTTIQFEWNIEPKLQIFLNAKKQNTNL
jgi:hypothetical protein